MLLMQVLLVLQPVLQLHPVQVVHKPLRVHASELCRHLIDADVPLHKARATREPKVRQAGSQSGFKRPAALLQRTTVIRGQEGGLSCLVRSHVRELLLDLLERFYDLVGGRCDLTGAHEGEVLM